MEKEMKLLMEVKAKEQRIEHLQLKSREAETDLQIGEKKREALEQEIERLKRQNKESDAKLREATREIEKVGLENRNLRNQNEEKTIEMGKSNQERMLSQLHSRKKSGLVHHQQENALHNIRGLIQNFKLSSRRAK